MNARQRRKQRRAIDCYRSLPPWTPRSQITGFIFNEVASLEGFDWEQLMPRIARLDCYAFGSFIRREQAMPPVVPSPLTLESLYRARREIIRLSVDPPEVVTFMHPRLFREFLHNLRPEDTPYLEMSHQRGETHIFGMRVIQSHWAPEGQAYVMQELQAGLLLQEWRHRSPALSDDERRARGDAQILRSEPLPYAQSDDAMYDATRYRPVRSLDECVSSVLGYEGIEELEDES